MKRCPQCYEVYDESERFCEADGQELLADPTSAPEPSQYVAPAPPAAGPSWVPAAILGILIGIGIGAGIFAAITLSSGSKENEPQVVREAPEVRQSAPSVRATAVANPAPTAEPEASPSPEAEEEAEAAASPQATEDNKSDVAEFNRGPISTGKKAKIEESEAGLQTVIEMQDGSTLDVDAAWEDKQGIWYRRSGLVSFVESSRVKAITARKGVTKTPELQDR
ncbi:MAG TPA: hypothetical protein VJM50_01395 [Pyrinomonadaceae bacterium]|nr:hypothetical protein [Pyrinomonadaceae bacterium]